LNEYAIAQIAGIVYDRVDPAEVVQRALNYFLRAGPG